MKRPILILLAAIAAAGTAVAQKGPPEKPPLRPTPEEMLERFDADGSGALELDEIETAFEVRDEIRARMLEARARWLEDRGRRLEDRGQRFDRGPRGARADRRGPPDAPRGNRANGDRRPVVDGDRLVERFDFDGDGYLKADEVEEMIATFRERAGGRRR